MRWSEIAGITHFAGKADGSQVEAQAPAFVDSRIMAVYLLLKLKLMVEGGRRDHGWRLFYTS